MRRVAAWVCGLAVMAGGIWQNPAWAQAPVEPTPADAATATDPATDPAATDIATDADAVAATPDGLAAYVAGLVEGVRLRNAIPGVVVSIVRDDRVLLAQGYGQAALQPERAADAQASLFRIASISKTFTYTAAMQLVERGTIAMDDPVNMHLPDALQVRDDGYAEPVRVRHLLSHTAGFEDRALGHLFERDAADERSLVDYLAQERPRRVRAPDTAAVYSNYSVALLGALVAHRSGQLFENYIEQHLTGPLGMARTTFREPLQDSDPRRLDPMLAADIAQGYSRQGGQYVAGEFEFMAHGAPSGGISSSANDMARWMRVHLNDGELDGVRILAPETAQRMRSILFRNGSDVPGVAHGFLTESFGPYFAYGHGGATMYFHSGMVLIPELRLGVFVSANAAHSRAAVRDLVRLIVEHLAPEARPQLRTVTMSPDELARYAGVYRGNRRPYRGAEKAVLGLDAETIVSAADDGSLRVRTGGETLRLLPVGAHLFQDADGNGRTQFLLGANGDIAGYSYSPGIVIMERIGPLERARTLFALLAVVVLIALVRLWRGWRRYRHNPPRPGLFPVKALSLFNAVAWLAFLAAAFLAARGMGSEGNAVMFTYPSPMFMLMLVLATTAAALTVLEVLSLVPVWRSRWRGSAKLRYTGAVAILALTVYVLWTWNLVGLRV